MEVTYVVVEIVEVAKVVPMVAHVHNALEESFIKVNESYAQVET